MSRPELHPTERPNQQYCFGDYVLDLDGGFLRCRGEEVSLRPKSFEVLACLVKHHGRLVTKAALMETIWPDTAVTDNSLAHCLLEIRRALADESQQLIRTVARRGYVFTATVTTPAVQFPRQIADTPTLALPANRMRVSRRHIVTGAAALVIVGVLLVWLMRHPTESVTYTQLTNFTDSAAAPTLSPDGRMLAFLRSDDWFLTPDEIYIKMLPGGEAVQLTHDPRRKCCIAFSPDGSRVAYSVIEDGGGQAWSTYTVPVLGGGAPALLMSNAAGLTWLDQRRVLFSEIRTGFHMGIVTATVDRAEYRKIYFPAHERAMAHYSYGSPDRKWALVLEMDPVWQPCRIVPMTGGSAGRQVGPPGPCTSAAWSPSANWMYFSAEVNGTSHLWRQRFPRGTPEQITFGPTEEQGVAAAPDGRSLVTSIGMHESEIWLHDTSGDRRLSSEGFVEPMRLRDSSFPSARFTADGKSLFYLTRRNSDSAPSELWRMDLKSGKSEALLPGVTMAEYDLSTDLKEVVFSTQPDVRSSELWLAPLERSAQPKRIAAAGAASPQFGPDDQVLFQWTQGTSYYLAKIKKDGSRLEKVMPQPVGNIWGISPDRRWVVGYVMPPENVRASSMAIPVTGGAPLRICETTCPVAWAPDGRFLYVGIVPKSLSSAGKTLAIPVPAGESLPKLPKSGIRGVEDVAAFAGARVIEGWMISPGPDPAIFAYTKLTTHRNLFRIPLRER